MDHDLWPKPNANWRLAPGRAAVFLVAAETAPGWASQITEADRTDLRRWRLAADQERFLAARGALRTILARVVGETASAIRFCLTPRGRPYLNPFFGRPEVDFNVSHAHEWILIAVCRGGRVGIDVEFGGRHLDLAAVGKLILTTAERERVTRLSAEADRQALLLHLWVRKEAVAKADGRGLACMLQPFAADRAEAGERVVPLADEGNVVRNWHVFDLDVPQGYRGALATDLLLGAPSLFSAAPDTFEAGSRS